MTIVAKRIVLLTPNKGMFRLSESLVSHYENVEVKVGLLEEGARIALELERQTEVAVFIARGGTAMLVRQAGIQTPLVEIPVTVYDLIRSVAKARKISTRIGVVGFSNMIRGIEELAPILGVELRVFYLDREGASGQINQLAEQQVQYVANQGIEVIIGGVITCAVASRYNIPSVLIETGKEAILEVVEEAQRVAVVVEEEKAKTERLKAILEFASEGIVTTDARGIVTVCNPAAEKIMGVKAAEVLGKPVNHIMRDMIINRVLATGEMVLGELQSFNNAQVVTNNVPILANNQILGAVSTFQNVTKIQECEQNIRRRLRSRTHSAKFTFEDIIGTSNSLLRAKETARQFALVGSNLLITGETGTGKELFAQAVHNYSGRKQGPFVAINCAALPESLLESELFGYKEGAFTGAKRGGKPGLFSVANQGTIFLDEVSEISLPLQSKLLRVLQEKEIRPLGGDRVVPIDVRVIAATNKNLRTAVQEGLFRKDLFFRLNVLNLSIPPLRERKEDIPLLVRYFMKQQSLLFPTRWEITPKALDFLLKHQWPGNIRELENVIQRVVLLSENNNWQITLAAVREALTENVSCSGIDIEAEADANKEYVCLSGSLRQMETQVVLKTLELEGGNQTRTAKRLGISRTHIWRLLRENREVREINAL